MNIEIYIKKNLAFLLTIFSIHCLWISAVFDPVGMFFGFRYIALALIFIGITFELIKFRSTMKVAKEFYFILFYFCLLLPFWGVIIGLFRGGVGGGRFIDTSYLASGLYFSCSLVYVNKTYLSAGLKSLVFSLRLLCLTIFFCLIVYFFDFPLDWIWFFVENGVALFGDRTYANFNFYYLYFIASPMLIFLMVFEAWRFFIKPTIIGCALILLPVFALFLSGTRINMLMAIIGVPFVYCWKKFGFGTLFLFLFLFLFLYLLQITFNFEIFSTMFGTDDSSNSTKINYISQYLDIFSDPLTFIFGQGFNAHTWSNSFSTMLGDKIGDEQASKTELTYLEMLRVFGIFLTLLFCTIIFIIVHFFNKQNSDQRWIAPAIILYILASMLNPYLFSSNGMLLLGFACATLGKYKNNIKTDKFLSM